MRQRRGNPLHLRGILFPWTQVTVSLKVLGAGAVSRYLFAQRAHTVAEHGRTDSHFNLKTEPLWPTALQCATVKSGKSNKRQQGQKSLSGSAGTAWPPFGPLLILNPLFLMLQLLAPSILLKLRLLRTGRLHSCSDSTAPHLTFPSLLNGQPGGV